jgi:kexin
VTQYSLWVPCAHFRGREESPIGDWTIRVFDKEDPGHNGTFLGWTMSLWGSVIDPAQAKEYIVPQIEHTLPPDHEAENPDLSTTTKVLPKPTDHLPGDHDQAEGEATKPAFPQPTESPESATSTSTTTTLTSTGTMVPTVDEGLTSQMSNLFGERGWIFAAGAVVILFGVGVGIFFWRRAARRRQNYTSLPGDDVAMGSIRHGPAGRTRELYDAFGEVSDDEDEVDERTGLHDGRDSRVGLGFHAGFLDDDNLQSATTPHSGAAPYRDDPTDQPRRGGGSPGTDESWEDATQAR